MSGFLKHRQPDLVEWMDQPDCDPAKLEQTYQYFSTINFLLSGWKRIYKTQIRPKMSDKNRTYSFLDIGFGGGDIPIKIAKWAKDDGYKINILAIELDDRALQFISKIETDPDIEFKKVHTRDLLDQKRTFDFVLSNHVLHHLKDDEINILLKDAEQLANISIVFSDIERNLVGYGLFKILTPIFFKNSFITEDGLLSIRRSFKFEELQSIIPKKWNLDQMPLFRLLLTLDIS